MNLKIQNFFANEQFILLDLLMFICMIYHIVTIFSFLLLHGAAMTQSVEHSIMDWRAQVRGSPGETLPCTQMALVHVKSEVVAMSSKFPLKIILTWVSKWRNHPLSGGSKLWWHVSGLFLEMSPRPSAAAHSVALVRR